MAKDKAVFLDRDGTINIDDGYVYKTEDFKFIPDSLKALKLLSKTDYKLIIVTSQSGIGRKYYTIEDFNNLTKYMLDIFKKEGIRMEEVYFCPHSPEEGCECRKPNPGMINQALKKYDIDLKNSYVIGDKTSDIQLGANVGCKTILVKTGKAGEDKRYSAPPTHVVKDLLGAAKIIIKE